MMAQEPGVVCKQEMDGGEYQEVEDYSEQGRNN